MIKSDTDISRLPRVLQRFLHYISFDTTADDSSSSTPTSEGQKLLAEELCRELKALGADNAHVTEHGIVMASIPATPGCENHPVMGFIAHMDTSPEAKGGPVNWRIAAYQGGDIVLDAGEEIVTKVSRFPELKRYAGQDIVVTDGHTLLGADDKAGIAVVMGVAEALLSHPEIPHAGISIAFTPDEEISRGTEHFDLQAFGADYAYTVDGGELGEIDVETFNAAIAKVTMHGTAVHPGIAKGKMVNALRLVTRFVETLPKDETPERTDKREGFYHPIRIEGGVEQASVIILIRDHDEDAFEVRKSRLAARAYDYDRYGEGTCRIVMRDQYYNMKKYLKRTPKVLSAAKAAIRACGVTPVKNPVRGGTDGAKLSEAGLPCPNLFTGGLYFHGVHECLPVPSLLKAEEVAVTLARMSAEIESLR
ncbi:MAG: peptidase T [Sutterella sp.]|nr:peptidase T [Sutterella sp.]